MASALAVSLAACAGGESTGGGDSETTGSEKEGGSSESIELSISHIMVNESDSQVKAWNKALEEYKETHPDITIKEDKADNDAYKTKLKTTLAAGSAPDVFYS